MPAPPKQAPPTPKLATADSDKAEAESRPAGCGLSVWTPAVLLLLWTLFLAWMALIR